MGDLRLSVVNNEQIASRKLLQRPQYTAEANGQFFSFFERQSQAFGEFFIQRDRGNQVFAAVDPDQMVVAVGQGLYISGRQYGFANTAQAVHQHHFGGGFHDFCQALQVFLPADKVVFQIDSRNAA